MNMEYWLLHRDTHCSLHLPEQWLGRILDTQSYYCIHLKSFEISMPRSDALGRSP